MKYKEGDLVWVASAFEGVEHHDAPALVIRAYISQPKIFLSNPRENKLWLEEEDVGSGWVYDIFINGMVDEAVLTEWLIPFEITFFE
jgi:hypothetical protein